MKIFVGLTALLSSEAVKVTSARAKTKKCRKKIDHLKIRHMQMRLMYVHDHLPTRAFSNSILSHLISMRILI